MTIRDLKHRDTGELLEFLRRDFPDEERLMGWRPEGFAKVVARVFRWDTRLITGLLRLVGRPIFRFFVVEEEGHLVATTLLTFGPRSGYISMVAVEPAYRRRGLARALLEDARTATVRRHRPYVALDVLEQNAPARTLYAAIGYRPLRRASQLVLERPDSAAARNPPAGLRPMLKSDGEALAVIVREEKPPEVEAVLPTTAGDIAGSAWAGRILESESASWVIDTGSGPIAWVSATSSPATEAAHLAAPIIAPTVAPEAAQALVETAVSWCARRQAPRILTMIPDENLQGRAAVEAAGFHDVLRLWTLYRPAA